MPLLTHLKVNPSQLRQRTAPMLLLALLALGTAAQAQSFATKKISFFVPWPAGGSIGTTKALKAPVNGHTLLMSSQQDLVLSPFSGRVDFALLPIAGPFPDYLESGKIRGLAVLSDKPNARFPKIPLASATKGLENMNFSLWSAVHVSSAVPAPIVEQLNKAVLAALAKPEVRKSIEARGSSVFEPMSVQQAHAYYLDDVKTLGSLAKASGFVPQ